MTNMMQEIRQQPQVLKDCVAYNDQALDAAVAEIREKEPAFVVIAARGTSDHAAVYGKYLFEVFTGLPVVLAAPSVLTMYKRTLRLSRAVVVGISQSGEAQDVLRVLEEGNSQSAVTIGITNALSSPLARAGKHLLYCDAGVEKSVAATKTFTTQLMLLAQLVARLSEDREVCAQLGNVPALVSETIDGCGEAVRNVVQRYRFINECITLARGMNYAVAMEAALKIQETTYVRAKAFASSDFYHGPLAIAQKDMPVILYAPTGPSFGDEMEIMKRLKEAEADILLISNDTQSAADARIVLPKAESDVVAPFACAAVAQLFACHLAHLKGLDPDAPRMLHKVTVTV